MPLLTRSIWIFLGILVLLFLLYWLIFGSQALQSCDKYQMMIPARSLYSDLAG